MDYSVGLSIGMGIVFVYAVMGGMKGITYTQIAQYCVLILAYTIPAIFISLNLTGNPIPADWSRFDDGGPTCTCSTRSTRLSATSGSPSTRPSQIEPANMFMYTMSLMIGTAGLPHVIIRFFTVPKVRMRARRRAGHWCSSRSSTQRRRRLRPWHG